MKEGRKEVRKDGRKEGERKKGRTGLLLKGVGKEKGVMSEE